jgi:hypothetical protein
VSTSLICNSGWRGAKNLCLWAYGVVFQHTYLLFCLSKPEYRAKNASENLIRHLLAGILPV